MNLKNIEKLLQLLKANGVTHYKDKDLELHLEKALYEQPKTLETKRRVSRKSPPTGAAIPPVDVEIPHHVNEVQKLLKLSDEDLVDKLFPDYSQLQKES